MDGHEVARRLEVSRATVYALCARGLLPHARVGVGRGVIRVNEQDLRVFLERCRPDQPVPAKDQPDRMPL